MTLLSHVEIIPYSGVFEGESTIQDKNGIHLVHDIGSSMTVLHGEEDKAVKNFYFGPPRVHGFYTAIKVIDSATPALIQSMVSEKPLYQVTVRRYMEGGFEKEDHYFTITMTYALVTGYELKDDLEYITFAYQEISWCHELSKKESLDRLRPIKNEYGESIFAGRTAPHLRQVKGYSAATRSDIKPPEKPLISNEKKLEMKSAELNKNSNNSPADLEIGHPVNAAIGAVVEQVTDFTVPGRLPLVWDRHYSSQEKGEGVLGKGWQCPADARLVFEEDGTVVFHHGTKSASVFPHRPLTTSAVPDFTSDYFLHENSTHYIVTTLYRLNRHFPKNKGVKVLRLEKIRDTKNNSLVFNWGPEGLTGITDGSGIHIRVERRNGRICRMVRTAGEHGEMLLSEYAYHEKTGELSGVRDLSGQAATYAHDDQSRITRLTLRNGITFHYVYEGDRCVRTFGDDGLFDYRFRYDVENRETQITNSLNATETFRFNENHKHVSIIDPNGHETRYAYDSKGRPTEVTDPLGRKTSYTYDFLGNLTTITRPDKSAITIAYDENCNPATITDAGGNTVRQEFRDRALLTKRLSPSGADTLYAYNDQGDLVSVTDAKGSITEFSYDGNGWLKTVRLPDGSTESFEHDPFGHVTAALDALGQKNTYAYDHAFRLTRLTRPSGASVLFEYDEASRLARHTDENGGVTSFVYTGMDRVKSRMERKSSMSMTPKTALKSSPTNAGPSTSSPVIKQVGLWQAPTTGAGPPPVIMILPDS